jgi:hypothetical protein
MALNIALAVRGDKAAIKETAVIVGMAGTLTAAEQAAGSPKSPVAQFTGNYAAAFGIGNLSGLSESVGLGRPTTNAFGQTTRGYASRGPGGFAKWALEKVGWKLAGSLVAEYFASGGALLLGNLIFIIKDDIQAGWWSKTAADFAPALSGYVNEPVYDWPTSRPSTATDTSTRTAHFDNEKQNAQNLANLGGDRAEQAGILYGGDADAFGEAASGSASGQGGQLGAGESGGSELWLPIHLGCRIIGWVDAKSGTWDVWGR